MSTENSTPPEYGEDDYQRELREYKARWLGVHPKLENRSELRWRQDFLDNFFGALPGGYKRKGTQFLLESTPSPELKVKLEARIKLYQDIDSIIEKLDFDKNQLLDWVHGGALADDTPQEFIDVLTKIFIELRKAGYRSEELTS